MLQSTTHVNPATLVALIPISLPDSNPYKCGKLYLGSFYRALAVMYTLRNLAPGPYNLRSLILDTCSNSLRIDRDLYSILASGTLCNVKTHFDGTINNSTIGGVVTMSTANVISANRILAPHKIPLVGAFATSSVLNDDFKSPYVARTISPDHQETKVIADILKNRNWTYVSVVYSIEVYGISSFANFRNQAAENGICIAAAVAVPSLGTIENIKNALTQLKNQNGANVIVMIALYPTLVLEAAFELGILKNYLWIGTETWGNRKFDNKLLEKDVLGSITVTMKNTLIRGFNNYLKSLTYNSHDNIPKDWFDDFYQQVHKCQLPKAFIVYTQYPKCSLTEKVTSEKLKMSNYVIYTTMAATYAIASAIERTKNRKCPRTTAFQDCFKDEKNKAYLFQMLLETKWSGWTDESGFDLNFNKDRYWDVGYDIYNFVLQNGEPTYKKVGPAVGGTSGTLISLDTYKSTIFTSQCPEGQYCVCNGVITNHTSSAQTQTNVRTVPDEPRNYYHYKSVKLLNGNIIHTKQYTWPIWAIVICVPTCVGLFVGIFIFFFLMYVYPVRGGTTILGFMTIFGILCIYAINFAFFLNASTVTCTFRRMLMGIVYAIVFSALLVKSIDNWRFNNVEYSIRKYSGLTSACSLFLIALGIVFVQVIIPIEWLIIIHPTASLLSTNILNDWWWCDPVETYDYSLALSMLYVIFLVILTAVFSGLAWDSNSNYYESRWICVSCVSTAGCFLVWMVVSTNAGPQYRDPAVAFGNFFNATALLICLPMRKIVLLIQFKKKDDKNEIVDECIYANADQGDEMIYSNMAYEDFFKPLEIKSGADDGF